MNSIRHLICAAACLLTQSFALGIGGEDGKDLFADAPALVGTNVLANVDVRDFTREPGEPVLDETSSEHTAWWKWTPAESGYCVIESAVLPLPPSVTEVLLGVFTGNNLATLVPQGVVSKITRTVRVTRVIFFAQAGVEYRIAAASSSFGGPGYFRIHLRQVVPVTAKWEGPWANNIKLASEKGYLSFSTTAGGTLSGKLTMDGQVYPFKGPWNIDGRFVASFRPKTRSGTPPLPARTLTIDLAQDRGVLEFEVDTGGQVQGGSALRRAELPTSGVAPHSGTYIIALGRDGLGYGGLSLSVKKNGSARAVGALLDGTPVSFGGRLSHYQTGTFVIPFYQALFKKTEYFLGYLTVAEDGSTAGGMPTFYVRPPAPGKTFMPDGLETEVYFAGMRYTQPARGTRALGFLEATNGAGKLVLSAVPGEISDVSEPLAFTDRNKFQFQNKRPRRPALKLNTRTGLLTGSITEPAGKKRKLFGVLIKDEEGVKVYGHSSGRTTNVPFTVIP